jgi:quercetin dioxygenase-like cupin family protein
MALITRPVMLGALKGVVYFFEKAGDELPVHVHDETTNHITIVSIGSFRCVGNAAILGRIIEQGQVIDWPANQPHGFVALSDGAKMIQINKSYQPS